MFDTDEDEGEAGILRVLVSEVRLDAAVSLEFKERVVALIDGGARHLVIDLSRVEIVDSSGLGALVGVLKHMDGKGTVELAGLTRAVKKGFDLTRMSSVFVIRGADPAG